MADDPTVAARAEETKRRRGRMPGTPKRSRPDTEDTALVERVRAGDDAAFGELYDRWFDRVYDLAIRITRDASTAGDVAQDAFLAAWRGLPQLEQPDAFGGWLLRIARNAALNRQRKEERSRAFDPESMAMIERTGLGVEDRIDTADDPSRAAEDAEIASLVWDAVDALGERDSEVLDLTLRHGLSPAEVADVVGTNRNAANQMVHRARNRLKDAVAARVLWRGGVPQCGDLADALAAENVAHFGRDAMRITNTHAATCELCSTRRALRLDPAKLFGAVPFIAAPVALKTKVAHAMEAEGAPMGGSVSVGSRPKHRRARRAGRIVVGVMVVLLVATAAIVALAETLDPDAVNPQGLAPVSSSTPTISTLTPTTAPTAATTTATTAAIEASAPEPAGPAAPETNVPAAPVAPPDPGAPDGPTGTRPAVDPQVPAPTARITVSPASAPMTFLRTSAPTLAWSTTGGSKVTVDGPGVSTVGPTGSVPLCPTASTAAWSVCVAPRGDYTYTVTAVGENGEERSASATLTIA